MIQDEKWLRQYGIEVVEKEYRRLEEYYQEWSYTYYLQKETSLYTVGTIKEFEYAVKNIIRKLSGEELVALHVEDHGGED